MVFTTEIISQIVHKVDCNLTDTRSTTCRMVISTINNIFLGMLSDNTGLFYPNDKSLVVFLMNWCHSETVCNVNASMCFSYHMQITSQASYLIG